MPLPEGPQLPSLAKLYRATAFAALVAAILLTTIVLPAEYGIDPTGLGTRIGLVRVAETEPAPPAQQVPRAAPPEGSAAEPVSRRTAPFRTDEMTLTLGSGEGAEIKATLRRGDRFVFSWTTDAGAVDFDMHGEAVNAKDGEYTSYWKDEEETGANGSFEAPFDGNHGWFWQNLGGDPVTITLKTSGFYDKLARP